MAYIYAGKIDQMIDDQFTDDAALISPFDALPTPPPHIVRGNKALKEFFHIYMNYQGSIQVEKLYSFAETDDSIFFQAIFTSKTGRWVVGDAWHMRGGLTGRSTCTTASPTRSTTCRVAPACV